MKSLPFAPVLALAALIAGGAAAQPTTLKNAKVTTRAVPAGALQKELQTLRAGEPHWVAYAVPGAEKSHVCCYDSIHDGEKNNWCCGGCTLEKEGSFFGTTRRDGRVIPLEARPETLVFLRMEAGHLENVRVFSADCALDAGGRSVVWLTGVSPDESVAFLTTLAGKGSDHDDDDDDLANRALTAIALHAGTAADRALEGFLARSRPHEIRKKAAFWLGNSRGRAGFEALRKYRDDPSEEFRHDLTFAFSQSPVPEAVDVLLGMARRDPDGEVRGQALFWLAQKAGEKAAAAIEDAIRDDPDTDVKEKAVFALTQIPKDQGIPHLIRLAKTHRTPEVREKAIFWLGQSRDPRALDFIEQILTR